MLPKIGNVPFNNRVFLAPMAGVTDLIFRRFARKMGCALTYTEFVSAAGIYFSPDKQERHLAMDADEHPVAVQIFGNNLEQLVYAAKLVEDLGADIVDINMGCPVPKVVAQGAGAALLKNPKRIAEIIRAVKAAVKIPVTLKTRSGWDKGNINILEVARIAAEEGAAAIALHPRTRSMGHAGKPDWTIIAEVKRAVSVPVIGNGGIESPQDALAMLNETGCDFVMIGSATMGDFWLLKQTIHYLATRELLPDLTYEERIKAAIDHSREHCAYWGEPQGPKQMRKYFGTYLKGFPGAAELRRRLNAALTFLEIETILMECDAQIHSIESSSIVKCVSSW